MTSCSRASRPDDRDEGPAAHPLTATLAIDTRATTPVRSGIAIEPNPPAVSERPEVTAPTRTIDDDAHGAARARWKDRRARSRAQRRLVAPREVLDPPRVGLEHVLEIEDLFLDSLRAAGFEPLSR